MAGALELLPSPSPLDAQPAALGNNTKSVFKGSPNRTKSAAGVGQGGSSGVVVDEAGERRRQRYRMMRQAGQCLGRNARVSMCQRIATYRHSRGLEGMGISINESGQAGFYGVGSCGDVWTCPTCALRIAEGRRQEVLAAMQQHRAAGGIVVLANFTFSHQRTEQLEDITAGLCRALRRLKQNRQYKHLLEVVGYRGQIRALEVMHREANGWHPHVHEIWFLDRGDISENALERLENSIFELWRVACMREGLGAPDRAHGVKIEYRKSSGMQSAVGAYVAKWGHELTHLQAKSGKLGSRSPWAILRAMTEKWCYRDSCLFKEYAAAMRGRAQLFWSRGLKAHFKIEEIADERIANLPDKKQVTELTAREWRAILFFDAHWWVLGVAESQPLFLPVLLGKLVELMERRCSNASRKKRDLREAILSHMRKNYPEIFGYMRGAA